MAEGGERPFELPSGDRDLLLQDDDMPDDDYVERVDIPLEEDEVGIEPLSRTPILSEALLLQEAMGLYRTRISYEHSLSGPRKHRKRSSGGDNCKIQGKQ